jgi:hypothetical protein
MPAVMLRAAEDKAYWSNVITTAEYALDIFTTFTGALNVYKFRHLLKISKLKQAIRLGKAAKTAGAAVVNTIEISSGSLSILIKLAELENEPWAQDLLELLFWLEIATLSGELSAAVAKRLRASARKVLLREKQFDDLFLTNDELATYREYRRTIRELQHIGNVINDLESNFLFRIQKGIDSPNYSKERFILDDNGISIIGDEMLHVTFQDTDSVIEFFIKRGNKSDVVVAEVNPEFVKNIRENAVRQNQSKRYPNAHQIDDPSKTNSSFGIRSHAFENLLNHITNSKIIKNE